MVTLRLKEAADSTVSRFGESMVPQNCLHVSVGSELCSCFSVAREQVSQGRAAAVAKPISPISQGGRQLWYGCGLERVWSSSKQQQREHLLAKSHY